VRFRLSFLLLAFLAACSDGPVEPGDPSQRARSDRPDQVQGAQVHVVYALPSDGTDLGHDTTGTLDATVGSFQGWLRSKAGGRELRMDTSDGKLDVTFVRLSRTDAAMAAYGPFVRDSLERELSRAGLIRANANKVYAVYYDGGSTWACGGAAWPPTVPGQVAAMFLEGTPPGVSCARPFVSSASAFPGYWEFAMLHDLIHTLGVVATTAPHHTADRPAHVPEPNDLMYSGSVPWVIDQTTVLDVGGDDYFGASVPAGVTKLSDSAYLTAPAATAPSAAASPCFACGPVGSGGWSVDLEGLPFHPPLPGAR
jgi:hypothetical protein